MKCHVVAASSPTVKAETSTSMGAGPPSRRHRAQVPGSEGKMRHKPKLARHTVHPPTPRPSHRYWLVADISELMLARTAGRAAQSCHIAGNRAAWIPARRGCCCRPFFRITGPLPSQIHSGTAVATRDTGTHLSCLGSPSQRARATTPHPASMDGGSQETSGIRAIFPARCCSIPGPASATPAKPIGLGAGRRVPHLPPSTSALTPIFTQFRGCMAAANANQQGKLGRRH